MATLVLTDLERRALVSALRRQRNNIKTNLKRDRKTGFVPANGAPNVHALRLVIVTGLLARLETMQDKSET